jgi:hypothetical protein
MRHPLVEHLLTTHPKKYFENNLPALIPALSQGHSDQFRTVSAIASSAGRQKRARRGRIFSAPAPRLAAMAKVIV